MRVDRSKFLLLASAIAAGCGPRGEGPRAPAAVSVPAEADAGAPATAPSAKSVEASPPATHYPPPIAEGGASWPAPVDEGPAAEGYWPSTTEGGGAWPGGPAAEGASTAEGGPLPTLKGMGIPVSSWTCNGSDDVGKAGYCAVKVPKSCAPFPFVHSSCNGARKYFKPKIAERAVSCMNKLGPDAVCAAMTYECKDAALRSACLDATADADCQAIANSCPKASMTECRRYLSGLNALGRAKVTDCMKGSSCGYGIYSCVEGLND
ncbi:MAG: hypothetical protein HYV09_27765 [Deltaproteobacteria bacterium]|nr:hypothetical protein [Deltaproteobacteria bacterium]